MKNKKKILIVENEALQVMVLKKLLESYDYEITGAVGTGERAIASVEENCPDLVLMDVNLGISIDGIEATEILRKKYNFPVFFISAYNDEEILSRIAAIENTWKLTKPTPQKTLTDLMQEVLASPIEGS